MRRLVLVLIVLCGCKKIDKLLHRGHDFHDAAVLAGPPKVAHVVTKMKGSGSGEVAEVVEGPDDGGVEVPPDAHLVGGDGSPAKIGSDGKPHGPGGPVFMGRGIACDAAHDHCMRPGVWFQVDNLVAGKIYRAVPAFEFEGKYYNWGQAAEVHGKLFKTEVATVKSLHPGATVVWFSLQTSTPKWTDNEYDALTSGRWEAGVVDRIGKISETFRVKGWPEEIPVDTGRVVLEQKTVP